MIRHKLTQLRHQLGTLGMTALVVMGAAYGFSVLVVEPLEKRNSALARTVVKADKPSPSGESVAAVYGFLEKGDETTDSLAKLYGIGKATGLELKQATYRTHAEAGRLERYEIVLPAAGSYAQIRDFLRRALAEIPVLSLDQMTLKRESRQEGTINAELRLTLHKVKR